MLKCTNKKCRYTWEYKGGSRFYTSCPRCRANINIEKQYKVKRE